jgi:hypothetical protein
MFVVENPVLQRELLVNLRMGRAFVLLFLYQALLGVVVYFAWPQDTRLDMTVNSQSGTQTRRLVDLFFVGQYVLASMMAPSFAAGSITGEKERKTYEMLSPPTCITSPGCGWPGRACTGHGAGPGAPARSSRVGSGCGRKGSWGSSRGSPTTA